jgi:DNA-binding phage protein
MVKRKTSQKPTESLPKEVSINTTGLKKWSPADRLTNKKFVIEAISECLLKGDAAGAVEIVMIYLRACNRTKLAKESAVSRSTIEHGLQHGNPTIQTVFKLLSA